jgi:predicted dehydrogenase
MAEKLKALLVGCGNITNGWLPALKSFEDLDLIGMADLNKDNAEEKKQKYGFFQTETGTDMPAMLERLNPDIVFDCTVPEAHFGVTATALKHGCHVLGEKPMMPTLDQAREITKLATASGLTYAVMQNRRYDKNIIAFRDLIKTGQMGKLTTLNADFYKGCHFGGFREEMQHVLLLDMAIHSFDQARFISGLDPVKVYCKEFNPAGSWYTHGASAMAIFEMADGSIFNYRGSWCSEGLNTSWQCTWRACCEKGTAEWDGENTVKAETAVGDDGFTRQLKNLDVNFPVEELSGHTAMIRDFLDCIKTGRTPQTICTDNLKSLSMVHYAIESAKQDKPVKIKY